MTSEIESKGCSLQRWNPIEENRHPTNIPSAWVSIVWVTIWAILSILGLALVRSEPDSISLYASSFFRSIEFSHVIFYMVGSVVTLLVTTGYLYMLRTSIVSMLAYLTVYLNAFAIIVSIVAVIASLVVFTKTVGNKPLIIALILMVCYFAISIYYKIAVLYSVNQVKIELIVKIINESSRALFDNFSFMILLIVLNLITTIMFIYTLFLQKSDQNISSYDRPRSSLIMFLDFLTICGAVFLYYFIYYFGHMVVSMRIAHWYWNSNENSFSKTSNSEIASMIFRNHIGTLGFASSKILPFFHAIFVAYHWRPNLRKAYETPFQFLSKFLLIFSISEFALILSSIHGYSFQKASRRTFDLVLHNTYRFLAVTDISFNIILLILSILGFIFITIGRAMYPENFAMILMISIIWIGAVFLVGMLSTLNTIFFCILEDLDENDGSAEKPYRMSPAIQRALQAYNEQQYAV